MAGVLCNRSETAATLLNWFLLVFGLEQINCHFGNVVIPINVLVKTRLTIVSFLSTRFKHMDHSYLQKVTLNIWWQTQIYDLLQLLFVFTSEMRENVYKVKNFVFTRDWNIGNYIITMEANVATREICLFVFTILQ